MAEAQLLLARSLSKAGKSDEASRIYLTLLDAPADARDDQGVGYLYYAAERLLAGKQEPGIVAAFLRKEVDGEGRLTLPELYMTRSLYIERRRASRAFASANSTTKCIARMYSNKHGRRRKPIMAH